jgi:hypothetical protein
MTAGVGLIDMQRAVHRLRSRPIGFFIVRPNPPCLFLDGLGHWSVFGLELIQQLAKAIVPDLPLNRGHDVVPVFGLNHLIGQRCRDVPLDVVAGCHGQRSVQHLIERPQYVIAVDVRRRLVRFG